MTRFADELRGSEGERCYVLEPDGPRHIGTITAWDDDRKIATVQLDDRGCVQASFRSVELIGDAP